MPVTQPTTSEHCFNIFMMMLMIMTMMAVDEKTDCNVPQGHNFILAMLWASYLLLLLLFYSHYTGQPVLVNTCS